MNVSKCENFGIIIEKPCSFLSAAQGPCWAHSAPPPQWADIFQKVKFKILKFLIFWRIDTKFTWTHI